jgi:hypothetical protein
MDASAQPVRSPDVKDEGVGERMREKFGEEGGMGGDRFGRV